MLGIALKVGAADDPDDTRRELTALPCDTERGCNTLIGGSTVPGEIGRVAVIVLGDNEAAWKEGVKVGASAFSFFAVAIEAELGIATGSVAFDTACCTEGASLFILADRDPLELEVEGAEAAGRVLRSDIIFWRLARASPPERAVCFLVAASTAASMAVRGAETAACMERGADDCESAEVGSVEDAFLFEFAETGRGGAAVLMGLGLLAELDRLVPLGLVGRALSASLLSDSFLPLPLALLPPALPFRC